MVALFSYYFFIILLVMVQACRFTSMKGKWHSCIISKYHYCAVALKGHYKPQIFIAIYRAITAISPHVRESGIRQIFAVGIRNPQWFGIRNPPLWYGIQKVGIRNPKGWNPESRCWDPESRGWDPESRTFVDSLTVHGASQHLPCDNSTIYCAINPLQIYHAIIWIYISRDKLQNYRARIWIYRAISDGNYRAINSDENYHTTVIKSAKQTCLCISHLNTPTTPHPPLNPTPTHRLGDSNDW